MWLIGCPHDDLSNSRLTTVPHVMFGGDDECALKQCVSSQGNESTNPIDPTDAALFNLIRFLLCKTLGKKYIIRYKDSYLLLAGHMLMFKNATISRHSGLCA